MQNTFDRTEAMRIMSTQGWLTEVPEGFRDAVLQRARPQLFASGKTVFKVGDPPGALWGLVSGGLSVEVAPGERTSQTFFFFRPGAWFGELSLLTNTPRRVGIRTTRDSLLLQLTRQRFEEIAAIDPMAWRWLGVMAVAHTDLAVAVARDLMLRDSRHRTAALLLHLSGTTPDQTSHQEIDLTQTELARIVNLSRGVLSEILSEFEQTGALRTRYRRIQVIDAGKLPVQQV
jgi:CRP-like cAMP-binding protein